MGLDINAVQFLIAAHQNGARFGETLMIGRQGLNVYPAKVVKVLERAGLHAEIFRKAGKETEYAEPLFHALGAARVHSLDVSDFEGAEFLHDLNKPIPVEWRERFDAVYDGGTLEHVFNFPCALQNCMEMVKPGGSLFIHTVANNWCGHGFYQFSPELFYRALSPENGFEVARMIVHAVGPYGRWFEVADPNALRSRVECLTFYPLHLLLQAKRTRAMPIFSTPPQQSDYTPRWEDPTLVTGTAEKPAAFPPPARPWLSRFLPGISRLFHVAKMGFDLYRRESIFWNRKSFRPVKKP
jgi:SAM-dependent methyltransferase